MLTHRWHNPRPEVAESVSRQGESWNLSQVPRGSAGEVLGIVYPICIGKHLEGDVFDRDLEPEVIRVLDAIPRPMPRELLRYLAWSPLGALVARKPVRSKRVSRRRHGGQWKKRREMR